jgi:hypothetical protein
MGLFLVMALKKEHEAVLEMGAGRNKVTVPIQLQWADGMIGTLPVFDNSEDAEAYAGGKHAIMEMAEVRTDIEEANAEDPAPK